MKFCTSQATHCVPKREKLLNRTDFLLYNITKYLISKGHCKKLHFGNKVSEKGNKNDFDHRVFSDEEFWLIINTQTPKRLGIVRKNIFELRQSFYKINKKMCSQNSPISNSISLLIMLIFALTIYYDIAYLIWKRVCKTQIILHQCQFGYRIFFFCWWKQYSLGFLSQKSCQMEKNWGRNTVKVSISKNLCHQKLFSKTNNLS